MFSDGSEVGEAFFELAANHFIHVHEQAHDFSHIIIRAIHVPGDEGFVSLGLEGEVDRARAFHRFLPIHAQPYKFAGLALNDRGGTRADLAIAFPTAHGADADGRSGEGILHVGIEFLPGIPDDEFAVVVDLLEQRLGWGRDGEAALHLKLTGLKCGDDEDEGDDGDEAEEDFFDHGEIGLKLVRNEIAAREPRFTLSSAGHALR